MDLPVGTTTGFYIDGKWVFPSGRPLEPVYNPATGEVLGETPIAESSDVEAAIESARHAFDHGPWPRMSYGERIAFLEKFLAALLAREERCRTLLRLEVGATEWMISALQWGMVPSIFRYGLQLATRMQDKPLPLTSTFLDPSMPPHLSAGFIQRDPQGVVAAISPYNWPLLINITKIVPALVTGNTVVLKPSPFTPYSALILGEIANEIGLPKGVLNIVMGGVEAGEALTTHRGVDMITFTGSDAVGAAIMAQAAPTLKRVHLELGGKSALIVRADADLGAAAYYAVSNITSNAGQGCRLNTRWIVHNSVREQFAQIAAGINSQMKVGDPADPSSMVGPLIREQARARTEQFVQEAREAGSRLVFGGRRPEGLDRGYYYEPTLFDDVDPKSALAQKEVFGPVGAMIGFDTDEEAVAIANDSDFGLHGAVYSGSPNAAIEIARQLRTAQVFVNGGAIGLDLAMPFGGYKRSGIGREYGDDWLLPYTEEKAISYPIGKA